MSRKIVGVTVGTPISPEALKKKLNIEPDSGGNAELDTTLTQSGKAADAKAVGDKIAEITGISLVEPAEDDIPKFFYGGALPQTKDDTVMPFRYISKTEDISGYCETKAQGTSSMSFAKKNQTTKFFKDADCTEKIKPDFKGWGKQNKFCFKANWIDISHARNIVSARLWADVVKSRANYEELPELLRTSPNQGAIDGFPVKVYANGVYQGRYTLNIPKDGWMANMDKDNEAHCILCGENYVSGCFRASAKIDESDWSDELHETVPASIKTRWNEVISFVMDSTDDEFRANLGNYFDIPSLIDYYLYALASCGLDSMGKNQIYMTYDGQRWIASMYDMDSTWGLYFDGSKIVATDYARTQYEDFRVSGRQGNLLYIRLEQLFYEELQTRWAELKNGALSIVNIINRFERFTDIAPAELVKEDYANSTGGGQFTGIPSKDTNNIQQIRAFALARQAWTDSYVSALTGGGTQPDPEEPDNPEPTVIPCTGINLDKTELTFNGEGTQTITATVTPSNTTDSMVWVSSAPNVASITVDGNVCTVNGKKNGNAVITVTCGDCSARCDVSVGGIEVPTGIIRTFSMTRGNNLNTSTGALSSKSYAYVTDFIDVSVYDFPIDLLTTFGWVKVCGYDANHNFVKTILTADIDYAKELYDVSIPSGVKYIRVSAEKDTSTEDNICECSIANYPEIRLSSGLTISNSGVLAKGRADTRALRTFIPVTSGDVYSITCKNVWVSVWGYDTEGRPVQHLNTPNENDLVVNVTIPEGVSQIAWSCVGNNEPKYETSIVKV